MALSRWRWIAAPVLAAALLAVLLLPGSEISRTGVLSWFFGPTWSPGPRGLREDVRLAVEVQRSRLREAARADSAVGAARLSRAVRSPGGGLTVVYETPLAASDARVWLEAAAAELARYPSAGGEGVPIVVTLYSNPLRAQSRDFAFYAWDPRRVVVSDSGRGACVVEVNLVPRRDARGTLRQRSRRPGAPILGVCALYQRFGMPGQAVDHWMSGGAFGYGFGAAQWSTALADASRSVIKLEIQRPGLGDLRNWWWGSPWVAIGCLDGTASLCERNASVTRGAGPWLFYSDPRSLQLVAYVLAHGSPAQFAAFWRSPRSVGDALRDAYGRPAGQLAFAALSHWYYAAPGGPRAELRLLLAGLVWAAAALALAFVAGRRWTTEI